MSKSDLEETLAYQFIFHTPDALTPVEHEWRFHPSRKWRFDFAWPFKKVAVEVEGGTWVQGRHTRGAGFEEDCEKYNEAQIRGWIVIRVTGAMIHDGRAITLVERALEARHGN